MPSYQGQLSEEQVFQLIAYIKSLGPAAAVPENIPPATPASPLPRAPRSTVETQP
jgi:hypothetical protein